MTGPSRAPAVDARPSPPSNGKPAAKQLDVHREPKKSLFAHAANKENSTKSGSRHAHCKQSPTVAPPRRPASSSSQRPASAMSAASDRSLSTTPRVPRLPRANTTGRANARDQPPITILEAAELAEKQLNEEDKQRRGSPGGMDASPSPAPRPWRSSNSGDTDTPDKQGLNSKDVQGRGPRSRHSLPGGIPRRPGSSASQNSPSTPGSSVGRRLSDLAKKPSARKLFGSSRIGPKVAETGEVLAKKASNSSLDSHATPPAPNKGDKPKAASARTKPPGKENDLPGVAPVKTEADVPIPSIEASKEPQLSSSWEALDTASPNKSCAWDMENEFTAGNLEVSDSPRIRFDAEANKPTRPGNTKIDEIMEREAQDLEEFPPSEGSRPRQFIPRLYEIEELENRIDNNLAKTGQHALRNTKIDEIRAREIKELSNKELARSRIDEIRARNARARPRSRPRSASPVPYQSGSGFARDSTNHYDAESSSDNGDWVEGEMIPHTPVTVFRKTREERPRDTMRFRASSDTEDYGASNIDARDRPHDVLRRLAQASSTSPAAEADAANRRSDGQNHGPEPKPAAAPAIPSNNPPDSPPPREKSQKSSPSKTGKNGKGHNPKPSVGFVGLRRASSSDSTRTKRSSMVQSDGDPTERIEREMQLFAPADNQSDRGSLRVPSPDIPDDEEDEEKKTADEGEKANRREGKKTADEGEKTNHGEGKKTTDDGKKTKEGEEEKEQSGGPEAGDLEETPRPKKQQDILSMPTPKVTGAYVETPATVKTEAPSEEPKALPASIAVPDKPNAVQRRRSYSTSDKGESDRDGPREKTRAGRSRRRAKSLPKHRHPLVNTAKPPTVRDDLMELQKTHNIEDSTLDDFGELLASKDVPDSPEIDEMLEDMTDKILEEVAQEQDKRKRGEVVGDPNRDPEMEAIARMTRSLQTGLLSIRSAKQGIERLEDQVSHADPELLKRAKEKVEKKIREEAKREGDDGVTEEVKEKEPRKEETEDTASAVKRRVKEEETEDTALEAKQTVKEEKTNGTVAEAKRRVKEEETEDTALEAKQRVKEEKTDDTVVEAKRRVKEEKTEEPSLMVKEEVKKTKPVKPLGGTKSERPAAKDIKSPARDTALAYVSIPLPRLYRRSPVRLTFLGLLLFAAALWCAAESAMCFRYCRPMTCTTGSCVWSLDDPTFGYAIPHKIDDWTTGGQGRVFTARLSEELSDFSADVLDFIRGTDIRNVNLEELSFEDKRKYRRRMKKKGLAAERVEPAEHRDKWDAWRTERAARERASAAREMGYNDYGESESMNDDVRV
ncbi:hypothetical protein VUR80DRAFT_8987 [Thermomyces stellatus]